MQLHGRGNQQQPRRFVPQAHAGKVSGAVKFAALDVPAYPHPVIEGLQRQVNVFRSLQLDDGKTARTVRPRPDR